MTESGGPMAVVLVAARRETPFTLKSNEKLTVVRTDSGAGAVALVRETSPSVVILDSTLPDCSGLELCRQLRTEALVSRGVPILFLLDGRPTPEQRVAALHCGAWEFIRVPAHENEVSHKVHLYAEAKQHFEDAIAAERLELAAGLLTSVDLARQAQRLGALMARVHAGLACVVIEIASDLPVTAIALGVAGKARSSDVVGMLSHGRIGIVSPATDREGAVRLAYRVAEEARRLMEVHPFGLGVDGLRLIAGFDAVANVRYSPVDPVGLIRSAAYAVRHGTLVQNSLWLRELTPVSGDMPAAPIAHEVSNRSVR